MFEVGEKVEFTDFYQRKSEGLVVHDKEILPWSSDVNLGGYPKGFGTFSITENGRKRMVPLFYKEAANSDYYLACHQKLKDLGIPVPTTMGKVNDNVVVMTDYSAQGAVFFGKAMVGLMFGYYKTPGSKEYIDAIKGNIVQGFFDACENLNEIDEKLRIYEQLATANSIRFPIEEQWEILVFPDKRWEIMLLDLHTVVLGFEGDNLGELNSMSRLWTVRDMKYMQEWLAENKPLKI